MKVNFRKYRHWKDHNPKTAFLNTKRADLDKKNNFLEELKKQDEEKKLVQNLTKKVYEQTYHDNTSLKTISRKVS